MDENQQLVIALILYSEHGIECCLRKEEGCFLDFNPTNITSIYIRSTLVHDINLLLKQDYTLIFQWYEPSQIEPYAIRNRLYNKLTATFNVAINISMKTNKSGKIYSFEHAIKFQLSLIGCKKTIYYGLEKFIIF